MSTSTSTVPPDYQNANPLLYTFRDYHTTVQPYFIIVAQFFVFEFSLRFWNRAVYGTWLLPSEFITIERDESPPIPLRAPYRPAPLPRRPVRIARRPQYAFTLSTVHVLQRQDRWSLKTKKAKKTPTFDLYDIFVSALPLLAHSIWYIYVQSSCTSGEYATTWNCYNLFGYRLYNYIVSPFTSFAFSFISKCILVCKKGKHRLASNPPTRRWRQILSNIIFYTSLAISTITFLFVGALVLPYLFTNATPMIFLYSFMVIIYVYIVSVITLLLKFFTYVTGGSSKDKESASKSILSRLHYRPQFVLQIGFRLFPYLMSVLFNLSQYFYYGEDYWSAISREANARDPSTFFSKFTNPDQIGHTILSTI